MDISPMQLFASVFGGGAGGSVITAALNALGKRMRSQAYTMGAVDHAVQTAMESVTKQLDRTEKRLELVEQQHEDCETNLSQVNRRLDQAERDHAAERAQLKAEIERLMEQSVPGYPPKVFLPPPSKDD